MCKVVKNKEIKRSMLSRAKALADRATASYSSNIRVHSAFSYQKRNYTYQGRKWDQYVKKPSSQHIREDMNILEHHAIHINIEHTETETIVMILTSSKGYNLTDKNVYHEKLSPIKADGSFTPKKDKNGKLVLNSNGNPQPDLEKGGQYVAVLKYPRKLGVDIRRHAPIDPTLKTYLDEHEKSLNEILERAKIQFGYNISKIIGNKDEE